MRKNRERLQDILDAIQHIERYAVQGRKAFEESELLQTWCIYHLQVIGESAARLGSDFHMSHPEIPWAQIVAMRNILVHEYFGVDFEAVWQVVARELPTLKVAVGEIQKNSMRVEDGK